MPSTERGSPGFEPYQRMEASGVPSPQSVIQTWFEGEIIDNVHFTFHTGKRWDTNTRTDIAYWSQFPEFQRIDRSVSHEDGTCSRLTESNVVFMRWKENAFLNADDNCGMTISGFYYVCLDPAVGSLDGFYYDVRSDPLQRLHLDLDRAGREGFGFPEYSFA